MFFGISIYANAWAFIHTLNNYNQLAQTQSNPDITVAVARAFAQAPHTFFIGGMMLMLAIQLFSLGVVSVQSKNYFEEMFYLNSSIYAKTLKDPSSGLRQ